MSDSIQSISQGNYILQGTVATSAGIVGDGSTQNPLRADETVLWETTAVNGASSCNLSESLKNFKTLGVLATRGYNGAAQPINNGGGGLWCYFDTDIIFSGGLEYKSIAPYMFEGYNWKSSVYSADYTYTNLTWYRGISKNMSTDGAGTTANAFTGAVGIKKVVGINRINNA